MLEFFGAGKRASARIVKKGEKKTKVICVDDHGIILSQMLENVKDLMPESDVVGFEHHEDALSFAREVGCDILFTEIELYGKPSGIELARELQELNSRVNIIFTTVCSPNEYAKEVMEIRPSGYLTKIVKSDDIKKALTELLYEV